MGSHFLLLFTLCCLASTRCRASISAEAYWKLKLPTTPMPQPIKATLPPAGAYSSPEKAARDASLASTNGYIGLLSYAPTKAPPMNSLASTNGYIGLLSYAPTKAPPMNSLASTNGYIGLLSYAPTKAPPMNSLASTNGYIGLLSYAPTKAPPMNSLASTNGYIGLLSYAPTKAPPMNSLASNNENVNKEIKKTHTFFVEEDLHKGAKLKLIFKKGTNKVMFLPRDVSNKIPFSSDKLEEIYKILSLDPKSNEANVLSKRIELCEEPTIKGVEKKCVTSLESMVDYVTSLLGNNNVKALYTKVAKDHSEMEYTIHDATKMTKFDKKTVVCHKMGYPYALYFCHRTATLTSYKVALVGEDGTKVEGIAACHKETNEFLENYMINVLKVTPGSTRICHFPPAEDNIIWVNAN